MDFITVFDFFLSILFVVAVLVLLFQIGKSKVSRILKK